MIKAYLHLAIVALSSAAIGWLACMIYYHIDPSDLFLYKVIYGTI